MAKQVNRDGYDERNTRIMMGKPITELSRLIGTKWFRPLEKLSERADVSITAVRHAVEGKKINASSEEKIRKVLEAL